MVACTIIDRRATVAIVVRAISVAYTPFLYDKILDSVVGLVDECLEFQSLKVAYTVGTDSNHIECATGEVCVLHRSSEVRSMTCSDKNI